MSDLEIAGREFDPAFYVMNYPEVAATGTNPLGHFCSEGWKEGKNPTDWFDTQYYLTRYPDIVAAGMNPFVHYLLAGRIEGRQPRRSLNPVRSVIESASYPNWPDLEGAGGGGRVDSEHRVSALAALLRSAPTIVSVSHDDYALSVGGIQNVVSDEALEARVLGVNYLHLSPSQPGIIRLAPVGHANANVRLNGEAIGTISATDIVSAIRATGISERVVVVIHHLAGHSPEALADLVNGLRPSATFFWAHDYFAACPSYALLRNDVEFCSAPPMQSQACRVCVYGDARQEHARRIGDLLDTTRGTVLHPSRSAARTWQQATGRASVANRVVPLAELERSRTASAVSEASYPLRIAHVGMRAYLKGWSQFEALAFRFRLDPRYEFLQLGVDGPDVRPSYVTNIPVSVSATSRDAMTRALVESDVDVAFLWSLCDETFGFTAYETMASGCGAIVRAGSGNMPHAFADAGYPALELETFDDLIAAFETGDAIAELASQERRRGVALAKTGTFAVTEFWQALYD